MYKDENSCFSEKSKFSLFFRVAGKTYPALFFDVIFAFLVYLFSYGALLSRLSRLSGRMPSHFGTFLTFQEQG